MKCPRPRLLASSRNSVTIGWSTQPSLGSSGSSSSLLRKGPSRSSLTSEDRKVSRTSIDTRKFLRTPKESVEEVLDIPIESDEHSKEFYTLQQKDRWLGWTTVYWGFQQQIELIPLAPGEVYQFRLKASTDDEDSDWSEVLTTATKDDVISAASLHRALDQGHMTSARKVLALRINTLEIPNKLGRPPLSISAVRGDTSICSMLLSCGADASAQETGSNRTALMIAAFKGGTELISVFNERDANWSAVDRFGQTALHYCCFDGQLGAIQLAVRESSDINAKNHFGWTPLMIAVTSQVSIEAIEYLLDNGAEVNCLDKRRQSILMQAVVVGNSEVVDLLIRRGALVEGENNYGHTAYDMAKNTNNPEVKKLVPRLQSKNQTQPNHLPKRRKPSQHAVIKRVTLTEG